MRSPLGRLLCATTLLAATVAAAALPATASPGPGSFTRITTPSTTKYFHYDGRPGAEDNHFTVSGRTSFDITAVDIVCIYYADNQPEVSVLASSVPVTGGEFSTVVTVTSVLINCRLRALPTGVSDTDYLASYAGPLLYSSLVIASTSGSTPIDYSAVNERGDGVLEGRSAGGCGVAIMGTIKPPTMEALGPDAQICALSLPAANPAQTGSAVTVDGHNAYLPQEVDGLLRTDLGLPVDDSTLTVHSSIAKNGDLTVVESAPLMRCNGDNTYPPNVTSCSQVRATGVTFQRTSSYLLDEHQDRIRDRLVSTDHKAHRVTLNYHEELSPPATGRTGFSYPKHGSSFSAPHLGAIVRGLGSGAGTMVMRSDINSVEGDPAANTLVLSWSRAPARIEFSTVNYSDFWLPFSLKVPTGGTAYLGFAMSQDPQTAPTRGLGARAVKAMIDPPRITSPHNHATVHGSRTTVTGAVTIGANGLPTTVTVNGHQAHLTKTKSGGKFKASLKAGHGKHRITVTARDSAGNTATASVSIRNARH